MNKVTTENLKLHEDIFSQFRNVERLQSQAHDLKNDVNSKTEELQELKTNLSETEENQDGLTNRNAALREKFNQLDANVRVEGDRISEELRSYLKKLGLKVSMSPALGGLVELKIQFSENSDYCATFVYDSETEDYDRE
jgi:predicted  nucleic acid-binding Zn-ribbon protein